MNEVVERNLAREPYAQPETPRRDRERNPWKGFERMLGTAIQPEEQEQQQRQKDVEMLLDGERPGVIPQPTEIVLKKETSATMERGRMRIPSTRLNPIVTRRNA
jgi:hypothetical protein